MFIIKNASGAEIARVNQEELDRLRKEGYIKPTDTIKEI